MHPFERFKQVKAHAREADLALYRRLIDHCHAWTDADAAQLAAIQLRLAIDDATIESDVCQHLADAGQREAARNRVEQYRSSARRRTALRHAAALGAIPDDTRWNIYESLLAKMCSDSAAPIAFGRDEQIDEFLSSREYSRDASGTWVKDGIPYERDVAVNMEFVMDYEAVSDACREWLAVPPTPAAPEEVSEEMLAELEAEVNSIERDEGSFTLAEVLVAGYQAYCDPTADECAARKYLAERIEKDHAELARHIAAKRGRTKALEST